MKEQIEEMRKDLIEIFDEEYEKRRLITPQNTAEKMTAKGYRKQSVGEWKRVEVNGVNYGQVYYQHKYCKVHETQLFPSPHNLCPNCGAKMKGGAE